MQDICGRNFGSALYDWMQCSIDDLIGYGVASLEVASV